jgi:hypothetical protein
MNEWLSDYCLTPNEQFSSYFMARTSYFEWNDDEIRFLLDQHTELDLYSASWLKQQSAGRHVIPNSDTLIGFKANQFLFLLLNGVCFAEKQQIPIA